MSIFDLSVCLWKFAPAWFNMVEIYHQISAGYQQGSTAERAPAAPWDPKRTRPGCWALPSVDWARTGRVGITTKWHRNPWLSHGYLMVWEVFWEVSNWNLWVQFMLISMIMLNDVQNFIWHFQISSECHIPWYPMISHPVHDDTLMGFWSDSHGIGRVPPEVRPGLVGDPMGHVLRAAEEDLRQLLLQFRQAPKMLLKWWKMGKSFLGFWHDSHECDGVSDGFSDGFFWISWRMFIGLIILDPVYIYIIHTYIDIIYLYVYIYLYIL